MLLQKVPCISDWGSVLPGERVAGSRAAGVQRPRGGAWLVSASQLILHSFVVLVLLQVRLLRFLQVFQVLGQSEGGRPWKVTA